MPTPRPRPSTASPGHRLSTIDETGTNQAAAPQSRLTNLPLARRLQLGEPPRWNAEKAPPGYSAADLERIDEDGEDVTLFSVFRGNLKGRGGWKRLALILLAVVLIAIGLGVGLGVGLSQNSKSNGKSGGGSSSPGSGSAAQKFPAGSWYFTTYLDSVTTSCTSEASTWSCFPGTTYASSPAASQAIYNWIITPRANSAHSYTIASSPNPFALSFPSTPLTLRDANTPNEHYAFTITPLAKQTYPTTPLPGAGTATTTCFFNQTTLTAALYTRKKHSYPSTTAQRASAAGAAADAATFKPWPYAVRIEQSAQGGPGVPDCFKTVNNAVAGPPLQLQTKGAAAQCACVYENVMF